MECLLCTRSKAVVAVCATLACLAVTTLVGAGAARAASTTPVPVVVDTDIFSSADDVGALATAFSLELRHEAKVIAVAVNTRLSRPAVALNSWRCVAAIDSFYGFPNVPIGTHMPNNGTDVNTPDFIGPCAQLAPASTPTPDTAVNVYRRALAAQADGSVVIASTGYLVNLADLLKSPPDSISPLSGLSLVAQKVRMLVVMGGGYPSRSYENNLGGDPPDAQYVANNWPGKLVWSGYEVGDQVHTGSTLATALPTNSPVRAAYLAFVGPGNWYYSYDLTAAYHAIRPTDPLLSEVGPGSNAVDSSGGNVFTFGSGNQYYLTLSDAGGLAGTLETLLDTLPLPSSGTATCNGLYGGNATNVVVPSGGTCTLVAGTQVSGSVQVQPNGTLIDNGASIGQGLSANSPAGIGIGGGSIGANVQIAGLSGEGPGAGGDSYLCATKVVGDVQIQNGLHGAGKMVIGGTADCSGQQGGNTFGHDVKVQSNADGINFSNNQVVHDFVVQSNTGGTVVNANRIGHDATCQGNTPAATGTGNTIGHVNNGCPS